MPGRQMTANLKMDILARISVVELVYAQIFVTIGVMPFFCQIFIFWAIQALFTVYFRVMPGRQLTANFKMDILVRISVVELVYAPIFCGDWRHSFFL